MKFNEKLPKLRADKSLSQEQLADMLDVSRQSVSKWESGQTYPEMDKLIMLSKIFKCSLDDLTNDEVGLADINLNKKNNIGTLVDELLDIIRRTINMFKIMGTGDIFKCIFIMALIFGFLLLCYLPFAYFDYLGRNIFSNFGALESVASSLWQFILNIIYVILFVIVYINIYKILYLDKYDKMSVPEVEPPEKNGKSSKKNEIQEKEAIIRKEPVNNFFKPLGGIAMWFIKVFVFFVSMPFIFSLLFLCAALIITIFLLFKGVVYLGILLGLAFSILFILWLLALIFGFLFDKKLEIKKIFTIFIVSIVGLGISMGIGAIEIANTKFIATVPKKVDVATVKREFPFSDSMFIDTNDWDLEYIADETLGDKLVIEVEYYKAFTDLFIDSEKIIGEKIAEYERVWIRLDTKYSSFNSNGLISIIIDDLSKKQIHNYDKLYQAKTIKIATSQKNIETMKMNRQKYFEEANERMIQEQINEYEDQISRMWEQIHDLEGRNQTKDDEIEQLKAEIAELNLKIQEYTDRIRDLLSSYGG